MHCDKFACQQDSSNSLTLPVWSSIKNLKLKQQIYTIVIIIIITCYMLDPIIRMGQECATFLLLQFSAPTSQSLM